MAHSQPSQEVVYTGASPMRRPLALIRDMIQGLGHSRDLAWQLFLRDFRAQYRRSVLGVVWLLLAPIMTALVFIFLNHNNVVNIAATDLPYPVFTLFGTVLWQLFNFSMLLPINSFNINAAVITKVNFPREALIVAGLGQGCFEILIKCLVLAGVMAFFLTPPTWGVFGGLAAIVLLMLLGFTMGLFLVPLGGLYTDISKFINYFSIVWFLFTPVVYPVPTSWPYSLIVRLNPVTPFLDGARSLILKGVLPDPTMFALVTTIIVLGFPLAWIWYRISVPILVERMSN